MAIEPRFSVVVPVFRSRDSIVELVDRIEATFERIDKGDVEIILVDDHSPDDTLEVIETELSGRGNVLLIELGRNFGQSNAVMCGFSKCRGELIFTIDDDLQNPPEVLEDLLENLGDNDVVYGIPKKKKQAKFRNLGSKMINFYFRKLFAVGHSRSSLLLVRKEIVEKLANHRENFVFIDGLIQWYTNRTIAIEVPHEPRKYGKGGFSIRRLVRASFNLFTNFSVAPLQFATIIGALIAFCGFAMGANTAYRALTMDIVVPGWASLFIAVMFLSGIQLLFLGLLGEYLGRLHINNNKMPQFYIRDSKWLGKIDSYEREETTK